jgi:hypothetical protein
MEALLQDRRLYLLLGKFDEDLAYAARTEGCSCGGRLHGASYPRKPRGGPDDLGDGYERRHSFCCAEEGCRRRATPPSLRFLGRRVYLGAVVLLATAMQHGPTPMRAARLRELVGASQRTLRRWCRWWQEAFCGTAFWKAARGLFALPVEEALLPLSLIDCFRARGRTWRSVVVSALSFLGPLTTTGSSAERGK